MPEVHRFENLCEPHRFNLSVSDPKVGVKERCVALRTYGVFVAFAANTQHPAVEVCRFVAILNRPIVKICSQFCRVAGGFVLGGRRLSEHFGERWFVAVDEERFDCLVELILLGAWPSDEWRESGLCFGSEWSVRPELNFLDALGLHLYLGIFRCIRPVKATSEQYCAWASDEVFDRVQFRKTNRSVPCRSERTLQR